MKETKENMMFQLRDGGLYETRDGRRARVTTKNGVRFNCPKSFPSFWLHTGEHLSNSDDDLVREIDEKRWVPLCGIDTAFEQTSEDMIYRIHKGHVQQLVTRDKARAMQPNYVPPLPIKPEVTIKTAIIQHNNKSFVEVTLPDSRIVLIQM
jgi:hypothetical protein